IAAGLTRQPDQHVGWGAKPLQGRLADVERIELLPHIGKIRRPGSRANLDQRTADKVDPVIEPDRQEQHDRADCQQPGERKPDLVPSHEVDFRRAPDDNQRSHLSPTKTRRSGMPEGQARNDGHAASFFILQIGMALGFHWRSQVTINSRVTNIAENSEVSTPMLSVTVNPFTGPEPSQNISAPATSVVIWLSRIVPKARLNPASSEDSIVRPARTSSRIRS